ncbi:VOC family protein [Cryptosporangium sp. NPDC051539]|uniref:VOC family protein n=1 Tax=Cryptosporangium sp. NPDC051539 TaxID=3363962 RepID=UPI0037B5441A
MNVRVRNITIDCADPYALAQFWSALTGYGEDPEDPNAPEDPEALLVGPDRQTPALLFVPVPEPKTVKNRIHLDLQPTGGTRDEMVARAQQLGATIVGDHRKPDGTGWVTLTDPEANEFCIERSAAERTAH